MASTIDDRLGISLERVKDLVQKYCDAWCEPLELTLRADMPVLFDAYYAASHSITFHNIPEDKANFYKRISHIAFWIQKFKPIRIVEPKTTMTYLRRIGYKIDDKVGGRKVDFDKLYGHAQDIYDKRQNYPINELVCLLIVADAIECSQREALERYDVSHREPFRLQIEHAARRFEQRLEHLVKSLRYHNYSARGFATMMEHMFHVEHI